MLGNFREETMIQLYYTGINKLSSNYSFTFISKLLKTCIGTFSLNQPLGQFNQKVAMSVCMYICPVLFTPFKRLCAPTSKVQCPNFLDIRNPCDKVVETSGFRLDIFAWKWSKIAAQKKFFRTNFAFLTHWYFVKLSIRPNWWGW